MIAQMMGDEPEFPVVTLLDRFRECREQGLSGIPVRELLAYIRQIAEELDALHAQGRLHGNVKPGNVRLDGGLARLTNDVAAHATESPDIIVGTPAYMAPEVWRGKPGAGSDQYALACSYAELRLGHSSFTGESVMSLAMAHIETNPELSGLPERETQVLRTALEKEPQIRFESCHRLADALERAVVSRQ